MSESGRVVWSEGMLLRTQHLQQQDRWIETLVRSATHGLRTTAGASASWSWSPAC
jgi:type VI secretion system protein ImpJ